MDTASVSIKKQNTGLDIDKGETYLENHRICGNVERDWWKERIKKEMDAKR